jgi:phenylalanyl-tRNA synthetase beta chain
MVNGVEAGTLGELHPLVAEAYELPEQPILVAELDLEALLGGIQGMHQVRGISSYPAIYQDIAVVVDEGVPAAEVESVIREAGGYLLRDVRLFDVYQGEQLGYGKKSLAYALTFQSDDKSLRDKDAAKTQNRIVKALKSKLGATLRA